MNELEKLKTRQLEKLKKEIFKVFATESILGIEHSLADCDYFDTNRNFPEDGLSWLNIPKAK